MPDDFPLDALRVQDDAFPRRDLTVEHVKRATFYLGPHGPFTERIPAEGDWAGELTRRIEALRTTLRRLSP